MRKINKNEKQLLEFLLKGEIPIPEYVIEMKDGNMGSISFDLKNSESRQGQIISAIYYDTDGVIVDIELTHDKNGNLFELDFWKVDFTPLIRYPKPNDLKIKTTPNTI